jgi:glycosyltransferase involved in cell wall biosynthesis
MMDLFLHQGFPYGLIKGMNEAKGKYVAILDHDDILTENSILSRVDALESNPGAAFAYGNVIYIDSNGKEYGKNSYKKYDDNKAFIKDVLLKPLGPIKHTTVMFKKECVDAVGGYDERNKRLFDTDLILKLADRYSMVKLNEDVIKYRTHGFNASKSFEHKIKSIPYKLNAIDKYLQSDFNNIDYKVRVVFWQTLKAVYSLFSFTRPKTLKTLLK